MGVNREGELGVPGTPLNNKQGCRANAEQRVKIKARTLNVLSVWPLLVSVRTGTDWEQSVIRRTDASNGHNTGHEKFLPYIIKMTAAFVRQPNSILRESAWHPRYISTRRRVISMIPALRIRRIPNRRKSLVPRPPVEGRTAPLSLTMVWFS